VQQAQNRRPSAVVGTSLTVPGPGNGTQLLSTIGADPHQIPGLSTPRDMTLSATGIPPSSLDFLADISAHHARTEPDINSMLMDEQPHYFGWNEPTPANHIPRNAMGFESVPNDMLQLWLEPCTDSGSNHGSIDLMRDTHLPLMGESNMAVTPDPQNRHSVDSGKSGCDNIPIERFNKVQRYWLAPPNHTGRLMNSLWRDIVYADIDNVFSFHSLHPPSNSGLLQGSRCGVDEDCRRRLQAAFGEISAYPNGAVSPATTGSASAPFPSFPPAEILDMSLDLYFRIFHPLVPFVHLPTFSAKKTHLPLLYVMSLIGMMLLGTKGTTRFVSVNFKVGQPIIDCGFPSSNNYQYVLERVTADLARCTMGVETPASAMSIFATAFLFLNLAVLTGV